MEKVIVLAILTTLILTSGCVQTSVYPSEQEKIEKMIIEDTNKDGIPDKYFYEFSEKKTMDVSLRRTISSMKVNGGYNLTTILTLIVEKPGGMKNVYVSEKIPPSISTNLDKINFETPYSKVVRGEPPFIVEWSYSFSGGERIVKNIIYSTIILSEPNKAWVEKNVFSPEIRVESIEILLFENLKEINEKIVKFFTSFNFYVGIGVYGIFLFVVFLGIVEIFYVFAAFFSSLISKRKFWEEIYRWIGKGRRENFVWIVGGVVLIFLGVVLCFFQEKGGSESLSIIERIGSNPTNSIGSILIILGGISLVYVFLDVIKGKIYGEKYFLSEFDILKGKIKIGLEKLKKLEEEIATCNSIGIDTSTESIVHSIEERRLNKIYREINEENYDIYAPIVTKSISDIDSAIEGLITKMEINEKWKEWSKMIEEILISKNKVSPEDLNFIPKEWRKWAISKYYGEHLGEALSLKGDVLYKIRIVSIGKGEVERILSDFTLSGKMEGAAIVRKDGLIIASKIKETLDKNLIAAIAAKLVANSEMISNELNVGSINYVILKTKEGDTLIYCGEKIILISLISHGENTGYVIAEAEKAIEKLNEMFK